MSKIPKNSHGVQVIVLHPGDRIVCKNGYEETMKDEMVVFKLKHMSVWLGEEYGK